MGVIESKREIHTSSSQEFGSVRKPSTPPEPDVYFTRVTVSDIRLWNAARASVITLQLVRIQTRERKDLVRFS